MSPIQIFEMLGFAMVCMIMFGLVALVISDIADNRKD